MIEIKNRYNGEVILSLQVETLSGANLSGADLSGADLSGADLSGADLSGADLSGANLSGADLYRADLSGADLSGANLSGANLSGADLSGADLSGANLSGANLYRADLSGADLLCMGNMRQLKTLQIETYMIAYTRTTLMIGCQSHSIEDWKGFTDDQIEEMASTTLEFWKKFKGIIFNIIDASPATG